MNFCSKVRSMLRRGFVYLKNHVLEGLGGFRTGHAILHLMEIPLQRLMMGIEQMGHDNGNACRHGLEDRRGVEPDRKRALKKGVTRATELYPQIFGKRVIETSHLLCLVSRLHLEDNLNVRIDPRQPQTDLLTRSIRLPHASGTSLAASGASKLSTS